MDINTYVSERISDLEKTIERGNQSKDKMAMLLGKYQAFVEIEEFLAGYINEEGEEE